MRAMSSRSRLGFMLVAVAAVLAGFLPHAALSAAERSRAEIVRAAESPLSAPSMCLDAACGKGSATPAAPTPGVALAAVLGGVAGAVVTGVAVRRRRTRRSALPTGSRDPLFHPPQFS
jgi:hypothetical protein